MALNRTGVTLCDHTNEQLLPQPPARDAVCYIT
jgi:hypothetical protein